MKKLFYSFTVLGIFFSSLTQAQTAPNQPFIGAGPDLYLYSGQIGVLGGYGGISYKWTPSTGLSNDTVANPEVTATVTTTYYLKMQVDTGFVYDTVTVNFVSYSTTAAPSCTNWVNNGDMDQVPLCSPTTAGWSKACVGWQNGASGTSVDCYNTCIGANCETCVPQNCYESIGLSSATPNSPNSGYGGLILYGDPGSPSGYPWQEYYVQNLQCALVQGQQYQIGFKASHGRRSNFNCGNIEMMATTYNPISSTKVLTGTAIPGLSGNVTTGGSWTSFSTTMFGNNETWITLGNLSQQPSGCTRQSSNSFCGGTSVTQLDYTYAFIDDISITPIPPQISIYPITNTVCVGLGSLPTYTLSEGGSPGPACTWTGPWISPTNGFSVTATPPSTVTPGAYTFTCTVNLGCSFCPTIQSTKTIYVNSLTTGPSLTVTVSPTVACVGDLVNMTASGGGTGANYVWSPSSPGVFFTGTYHQQIQISTTNQTAPHVYTYSVSTGGCAGMATGTYTLNPLPTFSVAPSFTTICTGLGCANLSVTGAAGTYNYTWSPTTGLSPTTGSVVTACPSSTTMYQCTGTDPVTTCSNTAVTTVSVTPAPTLSVVASASVCAGAQATVTATGMGTGGTYSINPAATAQSGGSFTVTVNATTTYTITGTNANGCVTTKTVTVNTYPSSIAVTPTTTAICAGSTVTFTASGSTTSYTWAPATGSGVNPHTTATYTAAGTYTVQVTGTSSSGCTNSATATITVNPLPSAPTVSPTLCANTATTLTVTNVPFPSPTYSWASPVGSSTVTCVPSVVPACSQVTITNPSGTYTVTSTNSAGCSASTTVSTTAAPNVTISTAPTTSICASSTPATFTLTASGASTYTWSTSATTSSITPSVTTTTSYSVTGTAASGCKNTATATITVIATPTVSVSAGANPLCQGLNTTLTASGATNYTWTPSGTLSSSTGAAVTASPTVTTTYTVTGTTYTCASSSAVITLTVNTANSVTITPSYQSSCNFTAPGSGTICAGGTATLTASSGGTLSTYTWTPGPIVAVSAVVSPTITTVYTVTGTGSTCSGSKTYTLTVSNCNCPGTALPVLTSTTIGSGSYATNSNTTYNVTGNVTLNSTDVKMGANSIIHVQSGAYLQLRGAHLSACYNMWQGIVVDPGGRVDVVNNSLIEDAIVAIDNGGAAGTVQTGTTTATIPIIQVNGAVFNCNNAAIRKAFYQGADDTKYGTSYFRVSDAVITCRCGIPFPVTTTTLTVYSNSGTVTPNPSTPDLLDYYSVANYTVGALKPPSPYYKTAPFEGIHLEDLGLKQAQSPTLTPVPFKSEIGVTATGIVLFDNLTYAINATNATFSVTNTAYQNAAPIGVTLGHNTTYSGGYAINAICDDPDWYVGLYVDNSWFNHMVRGIHNEDYFDMNINHNTLFSHISITPAGQSTTGSPGYGSYAMYLYSTKFGKAHMDNNTVADMNNGIIFSVGNTAGWVGTGNGQYVGPVSVTNNMLRDQFAGNSYTSKFIGVGISVSNAITPAITNTIAPAYGGATQISVSTNTVLNGFNGIAISNQQFQEVRDEHNNITMLYQPTISSETNQYGIQHTNNMYYYNTGTSPAGYGNDIYYNSITGVTGGTVQATFEKKRGIWSRTNQNHYVTCNTITGAGRAFDFEGTNSNIFWQQNIMTSNKEAYALSLTGVIGQQPVSGSTASDNQWTNASGYADTYTDATSIPSSSKLFVRSPGTSYPYDPQIHITLGTAYAYGTSLVLSSSSSTYTCQVPPARKANSNNQQGQMHQSGNSARASDTSKNGTINYFELIVQDSINYPMYSVQNTYNNKNMVYRNLMRNPNLLDSSSILANFFNSNSNSSWALFCQVEDSLYNGNYNYAAGLLSSYTPSISIEQNYKRFFEIFGNAMQGNRDSTDDADLAALASSCPMLNGTVVFQARALRNNLLKGYEDYEDNCPQDAQRLVQSNVKKDNSLFVYPNPTDGKLYISGFAVSDKVTSIEVMDITGKLILKQSPSVTNGVIELNLNVNNGVYFIKVLNEGKENKIEKVIISK